MPHGSAVSCSALASHPVDDVLGAHHREIEAECLAILDAGLADHRHELSGRWAKVERELLEHMAAEERMVFPAYEQANRENAQKLRGAHSSLRELVVEIGAAIRLRTLRHDQLRRFLDELRAHARHEDASLYRWAQGNLDASRRHTLLVLVR